MDENSISRDQFLTIRIWLESGELVGHVSLQTRGFLGNNETKGLSPNGIYVSIYPAGRGVSIFNRFGKPFRTKTLDEDHKKYRKYKSVIEINLYRLNIERIEIAYKKIIDSNFNFSILGRDLLKNKDTHNCATLIAYLLIEGGINELLYQYSLNEKRANIETLINIIGGMLIGSYFRFWGAIAGGILGFILAFISRSFYTAVDVKGDMLTPSTPTNILEIARLAETAEKKAFPKLAPPATSTKYTFASSLK